MGISFKKKRSDFHLSNGVFPIFCYEISATALAGRFCVARGTCVERVTQKFRLSRCPFPLCTISSLWFCCPRCSHLSTVLNNTVEPESGVTILFNIVDSYEQCGQKNIVQSCFHQYCINLSVFTRVIYIPKVGNKIQI